MTAAPSARKAGDAQRGGCCRDIQRQVTMEENARRPAKAERPDTVNPTRISLSRFWNTRLTEYLLQCALLQHSTPMMRDDRLAPSDRVIPAHMATLTMSLQESVVRKNLLNLTRCQRLHAKAISRLTERGRRICRAACNFVQSQTSAASRMFASASSMVSPSETHPGKAGTVAQ